MRKTRKAAAVLTAVAMAAEDIPFVILKRPGGQAVKTPPFHGGNTGSSPVRVTTVSLYGGIAQLVERSPHTREVTDSSSVVSTKRKTRCKACLSFFPKTGIDPAAGRDDRKNVLKSP